jgi:hypothetical protein
MKFYHKWVYQTWDFELEILLVHTIERTLLQWNLNRIRTALYNPVLNSPASKRDTHFWNHRQHMHLRQHSLTRRI